MPIDSLSAANAYRSQMKLQKEIGDALGAPQQDDAGSFANMVKDGLQTFVDAQNQSESKRVDALTGSNVDLSELVTAVSSAELTLNTVVAIRDKVITAYQDIIRMPI